MSQPPWKDRVEGEERLLEQLNVLASESATRRAEALRDGVQETGSIAAVARELGRSWNAVDNALKKQATKEKKAENPDTTTE